MKITWLGQAGLLFEINGKKILVDPYLSNSVAKIQPQNYRRVPVDERFLKLTPDIIIITHNHADHMDKETLIHYLGQESAVLVLASYNAWIEVRGLGGLKNNYVMFNSGTTWTEGNIVFKAVYAEHSDNSAIGVVMSVGEKNYYITGDTLYNEKVFNSLPQLDWEMLFLPVNGVGNNMNQFEAKKFAERIKAKYNVPIHIGLFDDLQAKEINIPNKMELIIYQAIEV